MSARVFGIESAARGSARVICEPSDSCELFTFLCLLLLKNSSKAQRRRLLRGSVRSSSKTAQTKK